MAIGFVGLGQMGAPIARNLIKGGAELVVCDRSPERLARMRTAGATTTAQYQDLRTADIIVLCLPDGDVVNEVLFGTNGVEPQSAGQLVIDLSTIHYATAVEIGERLAQRGIDFVDSPISGMEQRAIDGTLTVMCGGAPGAFERAKPYLDCIGNNIQHMGKIGSGQLSKLVNQLLFDINAAGLAEVLPMAIHMGLDPQKIGAVINSSTGGSYASNFFIQRVLAGKFSDGYPLDKAYKDLVSGAEISARLCIPMPVLAAATATYQMAMLHGYGEEDKGGMIRLFEQMLGVKYRAPANDA